MSLKLTLVFLSLFCLSQLNIFETSDSDQITWPEVRSKSKIFGKHGTPFIVETETNKVDSHSGRLQITSSIKSLNAFKELEYKWVLPEGVNLIWGDLSGTLSQVGSDELIRLEIEVSGLDLEKNENIILVLERKQGGRNLGASFVVASRKDLTPEYQSIVRENAEQKSLNKMSFGGDKIIAHKKLIY
jgi:hypothetical protein